MRSLIQFSEEVQQALQEKRPVVALESTIISHGMPYPQNIQSAEEVEGILRECNVTPATIVLHKGKIKVGLDKEKLSFFAHDTGILKASRRDIAHFLQKQESASTTVAATMYCAKLAGIPIFVTGGIGGVHPNVGHHFDISADLMELSQTPITVICSGAKSILDLPKTLEMLETHGVPVVGYQTNEFPAFYSHSSGLPLMHRLDSAEDIAELIHTQKALQLNNGIVIANPIPKEAEIPDDDISPMILQAQKEAEHINGKAITPFLLKRIAELTEGKSLKANMALIRNNALLGAKIAKALRKEPSYKANIKP